jgi:hypothetical protein
MTLMFVVDLSWRIKPRHCNNAKLVNTAGTSVIMYSAYLYC